MLVGRIFKSGRWWAVECDALRAYTQGHSWSDAAVMLTALICLIVDRPGFKATVHRAPTAKDRAKVIIEVSDFGQTLAAVLRQNRRKPIAVVARAAGVSARRYASFERGERSPNLSELDRIFAVIAPDLIVTFEPKPLPRLKRSRRTVS